MNMKLVLTVFFAGSFLVGCLTTKPLPSAYAYVASKNSELWLIDLTGADQDTKISTFKSSAGSQINMWDIAWTGSELFGTDQTGNLYKINTNSARATLVGTSTAMNSLAFDSTGQLWGAGSNTLYRINRFTGLATSVGTIGFTPSGDLVFSETDELYLSVTGNSGDSLVRLDKTNGAGTVVGNLGKGAVYGMTRVAGIIYGATESGELVRVDLTTGQSTFIRNLPATVYGMNTKPTPK
jgi:hypothetical protein